MTLGLGVLAIRPAFLSAYHLSPSLVANSPRASHIVAMLEHSDHLAFHRQTIVSVTGVTSVTDVVRWVLAYLPTFFVFYVQTTPILSGQ